MAENVRKAKSYKCIEIVRLTDEFPSPENLPCKETTYTVYWLAPGSSRTESYLQAEVGRAGIHGNLSRGQARHLHQSRRQEFLSLPGPSSAPIVRRTFDDLENLGRFSGEADRDLGTKEINGKKARGFQIEMKKMEPDCRGFGTGGNLARPRVQPARAGPLRRDEGPWLFRHPIGYETYNGISTWTRNSSTRHRRKATPTLRRNHLPLEEQVRQITEALTIYAEASGGHYPREKTSTSGTTTEDLCNIFGLTKWPGDRNEGHDVRKAAKARRDSTRSANIQPTTPTPPTTARPSGRKTRTKCSSAGSSTTAATRSFSAICVPKP